MKEEVSLRDLTALIKQRLGMIISIGIMGLLLAAAYTFLWVTPLYEARTQLLVNRADAMDGLVLNDIDSNVQMINTYKDIILGPVILGNVKEHLELDYTDEELADMVFISANEESQIFSLAVTSPDPEEAASIANEIAATFQINVLEIMNIENVKIISAAVADSEPISPNILNNLLIGLGVGLLAGFGAAMMRYAMAKTIDDQKYIIQTIGWPNLGAISELSKEEKTAIAKMQKQKAAAAKVLKEAEAAIVDGSTEAATVIKTKRIPDDEPSAMFEQALAEEQLQTVIAAVPGKNEDPKIKPKQQSSAHPGTSRERLVTVADMTKEKIDVILQNSDVSQTMDVGNKRGNR